MNHFGLVTWEGVLIFKGGLSGVRYQTPKPGLRAAKPNLSPYVHDIYRIEVKYIFLGIVHQGLFWGFVHIFRFFAIARPG